MRMRWKLKLFLLLLGGLVVTACTPGLPRQPSGQPMTYEAKVDIRLNGFRRTYRVHLPPGYGKAQPLPLVVVIHGAFDTAAGMEKFSGFSKLADQENFIALYPNGMGIFGYLQHWNAGHCCGKAAADNLDDVGFIATVIEDACARLSVDRVGLLEDVQAWPRVLSEDVRLTPLIPCLACVLVAVVRLRGISPSLGQLERGHVVGIAREQLLALFE